MCHAYRVTEKTAGLYPPWPVIERPNSPRFAQRTDGRRRIVGRRINFLFHVEQEGGHASLPVAVTFAHFVERMGSVNRTILFHVEQHKLVTSRSYNRRRCSHLKRRRLQGVGRQR